jgi:transaldolase
VVSVAGFFLSRIDVHREIFLGRRFGKLAAQGARAQRLLWASTSTKNPSYSDVKYVEPLIGPGTIDTLPLETLCAYRDHGRPGLRLEEGAEDGRRVLERLPRTDTRQQLRKFFEVDRHHTSPSRH